MKKKLDSKRKPVNKKRVVLKKGKYVVTRRGFVVLNLSKEVFKILKPLSKRIMIAGSIRRKEKNPVDVDIVLIPKDKQKIIDCLKNKGRYVQGGDKRVTFRIRGIKTEIYYATPDDWGAMLMAYTGPFGFNIGFRTIAKRKGYLLNQYGLFGRGGKHMAGKTEKSIYEALSKKYKSPKLR